MSVPSVPRAAPRQSVICPTESDRARFLDMHRRFAPLNRRLLVVVAVLGAPFLTTLERPAAMLIGIAAMVGFAVVQQQAERRRRPEVWVLAALVGAAGTIALVAHLSPTGGQSLMMLIIWPVAGIAGRFRGRVVVAAVGVVVAITVGTQLANGADAVASGLGLTLPAAAIICVAVIVTALRDSDAEHRGAANVDLLTGLLNRRALMRHVEVLEQQSAAQRDPIGVAVIDLDLFKVINDLHGHDVGDQVLSEVAAAIRSQLRAYDLAFRLGGEEFVVLAPGADLQAIAAIAETVRAAIAGHPAAGLTITASVGVAATAAGEPFEWHAQYRRADAAVYAAKRAGRDRVCRAPGLTHRAPLSAG